MARPKAPSFSTAAPSCRRPTPRRAEGHAGKERLHVAGQHLAGLARLLAEASALALFVEQPRRVVSPRRAARLAAGIAAVLAELPADLARRGHAGTRTVVRLQAAWALVA